jgi:cell division protein FtsB
MYKQRNLGYNSCSMAATTSETPAAHGAGDSRKGGRGQRTLLVTMAVFVSFMVIDAFVGERGLAALVRTRRQYQELAREVGLKQAENGRIRARIHRLSVEDPSAIEEIARREYGLILPGERLFIIHDVPAPGQH